MIAEFGSRSSMAGSRMTRMHSPDPLSRLQKLLADLADIDLAFEGDLETLERTEGRRSDAARLLGIGLRTLQRKLKEYRDQGFYSE